ncbi:Basic proline-rich protein [Rhizoctonia solani]|uniref:Basic proline-rich protein n=1 Tax=Rhizoctonia solani TaxID=456999 RepID=A0A0K6G5M8_9AGAM|nr:Basic proline-rich protein [Rhizoctonia solani]
MAKRRRNPEATASAVSLADTLAGASSSNSPSRVSAPQPRSRRPRQSSENRVVSSPDVRPSPYPDYPPPSFEEVIALDRNNAPSSTPTSPPNDEPARESEASSPMFLVSAPPSLSDPSHNSIATPWEHDRLLGLSLEERVRREFERNLKQSSGSRLTPVNSTALLPEPSSPAPVSSSPTATSVTAPNFLTPQNLSPSPSGGVLPLSATSSPKANGPHQSPGPPVPPKSPEPTDTPTRTSETLLDHDAGALVRNVPTEPQLPRPTELGGLGVGSSSHADLLESINSEQQHPQEIYPDSEVSLTSLLFTTRLRLDDSPEHSPVRESRREISPVREAGAEVSQVAVKERTESPQRSPFPRVHPVHQTVPVLEIAPRATLPFRNSSLSRPPKITRSPSPKVPSPSLPSAPVPTALARVIPEPLESPSSAPRRPPPPPPPRLHQVGSGVAARISAYEALLANAPKVPPPIPPRPRPRSQTTLDSQSETRAVRVSSEVVPAGTTNSNAQIPSTAVGLVSNLLGDTHIAAQSPITTQRPRPPPRPASVHVTTQPAESPSHPTSVTLQDNISSATSQPQSERIGSRPLPTPGPSRPERPVSMNLRARPPSRKNSDNVGVEATSVMGDTHTATHPSTGARPRSLSRPANVVRQATASPTASPRFRSSDLGPRSFPAPVPLRSERAVPTEVEAQALVPARIGPDGKLEIIPDAEVIWLDQSHAGTPEPPGSRPFRERSPPVPSVAPEAMAGPSNRELEFNPFEDSLLSRPMVAPIMSRQSSTTSSVYQPPSPAQIRPSLVDPGPSSAAEAPTTSPPHLADDFEYTDLDLLISRLEENEASRQGANYEASHSPLDMRF